MTRCRWSGFRPWQTLGLATPGTLGRPTRVRFTFSGQDSSMDERMERVIGFEPTTFSLGSCAKGGEEFPGSSPLVPRFRGAPGRASCGR